MDVIDSRLILFAMSHSIKYNCENGGPAPDELTDSIYSKTTTIKTYKICKDFPTIDISKIDNTSVKAADGSDEVNVEVISSTEEHIKLLKTAFDFSAIKALLDRPDFSMVYDTMHGVNGPYAKAAFVGELGQSEDVCMNAIPKDDFNGGHADPNLTYAKELVALMGLDRKGMKIETGDRKIPKSATATPASLFIRHGEYLTSYSYTGVPNGRVQGGE